MKYVALLRGINVGGNKKVPMAELKTLCEDLGYTNVRTLLNSGNIVLEADGTSCTVIKTNLEQAIEKYFGFPVPVLCRNIEDIQALATMDPFAKIEESKNTKCYCTFTEDDAQVEIVDDLDNGFLVFSNENHIICSAIDMHKIGTIDCMKILEKAYGKNITTRNWNTVLKIANL